MMRLRGARPWRIYDASTGATLARRRATRYRANARNPLDAARGGGDFARGAGDGQLGEIR